MILQVAGTGIHIAGSVEQHLSVGLVNVTKDVQLGTNSLECQRQLLTSHPQSARCHIQQTMGWPMRQKDIDSGRYLGPDVPQRQTPIQVECPVKKSRLPGTPIDADSVLFTDLVLQVRSVPYQIAGRRILLEQKVVIPRDDHLVFVRKRGQPSIKLLDFSTAPATGEIASADQQIPVG